MNRNIYGPIILAAVLGAIMYFLYRRGVGVSKSIRAILFYFAPGKDADRARVDSCTGWVRHAGRFRESRRYEFRLDAQLSKGNAEVVLLDQNKQPLLKLDRFSPARSVDLDGNSRYYLRWEFSDASGQCELHW